MKEPISTFTNLFYFIVAILLFPTLVYSPVGIVLLLSLIGLTITSGWYHWTKTEKSNDWDVRFMYITFNSIISYYLYTLTGLFFAPLMFVIVLTAWMWYHRSEYDSTYTIAWQLVLIMTLAMSVGQSLWFIPILGLGYLCNIPFLGRYQYHKGWKFVWVDLLHGFWHLFTAIGIYLMVYNSLGF